MNRDDIRYYLDSTFLKTTADGLSETEVREAALATVDEAINEGFRAVMLRPDQVPDAIVRIRAAKSKTLCGTVIDFPEGKGGVEKKLAELQQALDDGADEVDVVCDYQAFRRGDEERVRTEVAVCTDLALSHHKTIKWILETAALSDGEIVRLTALVRNTVIRRVKEDRYPHVFLKSSTGFLHVLQGAGNGATPEAIIMMLENACPLPVKASGGIRDFETAQAYIRLGVSRIGTSSAKAIAEGRVSTSTY